MSGEADWLSKRLLIILIVSYVPKMNVSIINPKQTRTLYAVFQFPYCTVVESSFISSEVASDDSVST